MLCNLLKENMKFRRIPKEIRKNKEIQANAFGIWKCRTGSPLWRTGVRKNELLIFGILIFIFNVNLVFAADLNYTTGDGVYGILADTGNTNITGALNLTLQMRACSFANCSDADWSAVYTNASYTSLASLGNATYFQYKATFFTENQNYTPYLFNATIDYTYLDITYPLIDYVSPTPSNNSGASGSFVVNVSITEENLKNITWNWNGTLTTFNSSNESLTDLGDGNWIFTYTQSGLVVGQSYTYNVSVSDYASNINQTETRIIKGNTAPSLSVSYTPNSTDELDPNVNISVTVNISDADDNFDSAILQWKNSSLNVWNNITLDNQTAKSYYTIVNATFTLPDYEDNITYRIWANDTAGDSSNSSLYIIQSFWDCTWNLSVSSLEEASGFQEDKLLGNFTITNNGDENYLGGCIVEFMTSWGGFSNDYYQSDTIPGGIKGITFNPSTVTLSAGKNSTMIVTGGFPYTSSALQETPILKIISNFTDTIDGITIRYINATMIVVSGATLFQDIIEPSTSLINIELTNQIINWSSYVRNLGGDGADNNTAYNVSFNWTLPSSLSNKITPGNTTSFYENLSDFSKQYNNLTIEFTKSNLESNAPAVNTPITIYIYSYGYENITGNLSLILDSENSSLLTDSFNVTFLCKSKADGITISSCGILDGDYVAPVATTPGTGGGASGAGSARNLYEKSESTIELVRGEEQEFKLKIENKLNSFKENIKISVSGVNSEYIQLIPSTISSIEPQSFAEITIKISSPKYFNYGKYLLSFEIKGDIRSNLTRYPFTENKYLTLYIVELSRNSAMDLMSSSEKMILEMNSSGLKVESLISLLNEMNESFSNYDYGTLKLKYGDLKKIYDSALESKKILEELNKGINNSIKRGISVIETQKLVFIAEVAFERGDYILAFERLKEAKLSYALEVKGEFNLIYEIKNNPLQYLGIFISLGIFGFGTSLFTRRILYKKKIRLLNEEEKLLLELMKVVQRDCFEKNKMSMEEYGEAMHQYENKLSETIEDKIRFEAKLANLMKIKGKKNVLNEERKNLVEMMKKLQSQYLKEAKVEIRVYENMMKSYASRLSEVEEKLVFLDAQESLRSKGFFRRLFK